MYLLKPFHNLFDHHENLSGGLNKESPHFYIRVIQIQGVALHKSVMLMHRSQWSDFKDDESTETLIVLSDDSGLHIIAQGEGASKSFWLSPSGCIYWIGKLNDCRGLYLGRTVDGFYNWEWSQVHLCKQEDAYRIQGVWGIDDDFLFVWGERGFASSHLKEDSAFCFHFNGSYWDLISLIGSFYAIDGSDKSHIVAVGNGLIAHWQGTHWSYVDSRITTSFIYSFVAVNGEEVFAATFNGEIFKKNKDQWFYYCKYDFNVYDLTFWNHQLFLASKFKGIIQVVHGSNEANDQIKFNLIYPSYNTERVVLLAKTLVWTCQSGIMETKDFKSYKMISDTDIQMSLNSEYWPE